MKKAVLSLLALMLLLTLAVPALAETMYVRKDCKVYQEPDRHSHTTMKLKAGHELNITDYQDGYYECKYGWIQEKYLVYELTPETCSHKWSSWHVTHKATCTSKGQRMRTCQICGAIDEENIPKTGHDWGKWKVTKTATCTRQGTRTRTCRECGQVEKESYYADHEYGSWTVTRQPTCSLGGMRTHACLNCGQMETRAIDPLPHTYTWNIIQEATDHSAGVRANVCQVCGHTEGAQSYDPEGTLRRGDRSEGVYQLQQQLVEQGYLNVGGADGIFGGGTEKALIKFQTEQGLSADGVAWPQTLKRLSHDFGPWQTVRPMTRTTPGERVRTCKDCGYQQRETVEMGDVIERGARGEHVRALQQMLGQVGYNAGGFDGIYGQKLDNAFTQFDAAHNMVFEPGKIRPADVDALVSAWLHLSATPLTESRATSAVNLALSVTPASDASADSDVTTYSWSLTNLGSEKCMFNALLLSYGKKPDFNGDDLVMVIDGEDLKPNAGNSVSGSFKVAQAWGDGNLNFAAMAVTDSNGMKWLSNTVTFEVASSVEPRTVSPLSVELYVNALPDGTYPVAFDRGDIASVTSGIYMNAVHIFSVDTYDASAIDALTEGDIVVVSGQEIPVNAVDKHDNTVVINGNGADGCTFALAEGGDTYQVQLDDDMCTYTDHGATTLMVDPSATLVDAWSIEKGAVTTQYEGIASAIQSSENDAFNQHNTTLTIENGRVVKINRRYVP